MRIPPHRSAGMCLLSLWLILTACYLLRLFYVHQIGCALSAVVLVSCMVAFAQLVVLSKVSTLPIGVIECIDDGRLVKNLQLYPVDTCIASTVNHHITKVSW